MKESSIYPGYFEIPNLKGYLINSDDRVIDTRTVCTICWIV